MEKKIKEKFENLQSKYIKRLLMFGFDSKAEDILNDIWKVEDKLFGGVL